MLDRNLVAVSPSTVYRMLKAAGLLQYRFSRAFAKAKASHSHRNRTGIDISTSRSSTSQEPLLSLSVLDGCSRYIVSWDIPFRGGTDLRF
jgi:putative transposase